MKVVVLKACLAALAALILAVGAAPCATRRPRTLRGSAAGVLVTELRSPAARHRLAKRLSHKLDTAVALTDGTHAVRRTRRELGILLDFTRMIRRAQAGAVRVPVLFRADPHRLQPAIRSLQAVFSVPARNAAVVDSGRTIRISPGRPAQRLNVGRTAQLLARLITRFPTKVLFPVRLIRTPPHTPTSALRGITGKLSRFSTSYFPHGPKSVNRNHNMLLSLWAINGTVVPRGAVFSFNRTVGERTKDRGFRSAIMFENGDPIEGVGAGISQTAGTLCNAALLAGLPMVQFHTHSHPVGYLPVGRDGTVAAGSFDMKFRNNTRAPIYIAFKAVGSRITAVLYGRPVPGRSVDLAVRKFPIGSDRLKTVLYRTFRLYGKPIGKERVGSSLYQSVHS